MAVVVKMEWINSFANVLLATAENDAKKILMNVIRVSVISKIPDSKSFTNKELTISFYSFPDPCQHGGICNDGLNSYTCNCMPGYTGNNCETNIDDCVVNPCRNGGSCIDLVNGYKCVCKIPFTGRTCDYKMDPCHPNRCHNGAKCTPSPNYQDFSCNCPIGYTGRLCDQDINECALSSPCRNGATCKNIPGSYQCMCADGYEGRDCTINTDDCASFPCSNGGTCLDGIGDFTCLCLDGFEGKHCEIDIDECASSEYPLRHRKYLCLKWI